MPHLSLGLLLCCHSGSVHPNSVCKNIEAECSLHQLAAILIFVLLRHVIHTLFQFQYDVNL